MGYVFSVGGLLSNLSVLDNIILPLRFAGMPAAPARANALEVLTGLGLERVADMRPGALATEACQLVQLARAMALHADLLLLEEPFRGLSAATANEVAEWLRSELAAHRVSVLLTTSDLTDAHKIGARLVALESPD